MLFVLGGNGTHAGANAIHEEVKEYVSIIIFIYHSVLCFPAYI